MSQEDEDKYVIKTEAIKERLESVKSKTDFCKFLSEAHEMSLRQANQELGRRVHRKYGKKFAL
jgi:hypothetical protein